MREGRRTLANGDGAKGWLMLHLATLLLVAAPYAAPVTAAQTDSLNAPALTQERAAEPVHTAQRRGNPVAAFWFVLPGR